MTRLYFEYESTARYLDEAMRDLFLFILPFDRAARIRAPKSPIRRAERAAAEQALRMACRAAGEVYADLTIAYTEEGKPYIEGRPDLTISVSHTPHLAAVLLAKTDTGDAPEIGLDIAAAGAAPENATRLAEKYFSPAEYADLSAELQKCAETSGSAPSDALAELLPARPADDAFLAAWCRMEARVKMTGEGISSGEHAEEPAYRRSFTISPAGIPRHHVAFALSTPFDENV